MLLVKTKLGESDIDGLGVFADQFIPKGTVVQRFVPGIDLELSPEQVAVQTEEAQKMLRHFCYKHLMTGRYILCADNARFFNHADDPNLVSDSVTEEVDVAVRDIQVGEELTVNYHSFDAEANEKLLR